MKDMMKLQRLGLSALTLAVTLALAGCNDDDNSSNSSNTDTSTSGSFERPANYSGFPITLSGASGDSSTSYKGQMARHVLRESLKQTMKAPINVGSSAVYTEANNYFANPDNVVDDTTIIAPVSKDAFVIKETIYNALGTGRNLSGKLFDPSSAGDPIPGIASADAAKTLGWMDDKTAAEVMEMWLQGFAADHANNVDGEMDGYDLTHGYEYLQLVAKFLMGAVFYNQSIDKYLDENIKQAGTKDNDQPYSDGAIYTGKEHSWDEGFGYFGAAANYATLSAEQNYEVAKKGKNLSQAEALALADIDKDGEVSLYTEYTYGPAYYASSFDKDGKSSYGKDIVEGFIAGRTIIANATDNGVARKLTDAERSQLVEIANGIQRNWEAVFAEAVYKYAGLSHQAMTELESGTETDPKSYYHLWAELKGFMMALQYGGSNSLIDAAKFTEVDDLIGYGPVLPNGNQVNGIDAAGAYTFSTGNTFEAYKANMVSVQEKLDALYGLKAKQYDVTAN